MGRVGYHAWRVQVDGAWSRPGLEGRLAGGFMSHLFASGRRNAEFHTLFKNIPQSELLIDSYSCALSREILIHGRIYLSANYICFNANILGWVTNIVLNLRDVVSVEKKMTALIIPNGLTLSTLHTRHVYASFIKRDDAYSKICRVWRNTICDKPLPTTELLAQLAFGKGLDAEGTGDVSRRYRERRASALTDSGMESIMSEDAPYAGGDNEDPALSVKREYNFGSGRHRSVSREGVFLLADNREEESDVLALALDLTTGGGLTNVHETDEEQREVHESVLPCGCAFHYKSTVIDQIVLVSLDQMLERLLFPGQSSLTPVPFALQHTLKLLGAKDVKFSPWKVYLGKWERRTWSCQLPATKILLTDSFLTVKVTDSVISRQRHRVCVESLMQVEGVPGGGCFVKWKLCMTGPGGDTALAEQCRVTITAAAAAPLGSWFKESIRAALLQQVEEVWGRAIQSAAQLTLPSLSHSASSLSSSFSTAISPSESRGMLPLPPGGLASVTLTYFDRKAFFASMVRLAVGLVGLMLALAMGSRLLSRHSLSPRATVEMDGVGERDMTADRLHMEYRDFVERKLRIRQMHPEVMDEVTGQLDRLDGRLLGMFGRVHQLRRQMSLGEDDGDVLADR